jgi:eukaryotic-like serine/threonine-protein kinase
MALAAGARLGSYEVLAPLGAGGMGEVYRARDARLEREVAIKVLPVDALADETRRARFLREARAASALNHPQIVTIHEIGSEGGVDFLVMELVPGETLARRLCRGALPLDEALRVAIPLADALAAAHGAGVVHRDLKPANVMVTPDGVVKVLDFGLAKLVHGDADDAAQTQSDVATGSLTRSGIVLGTSGYMSPEQARGGGVDSRSDIFSYGAVLFEMVTGRRAFAGAPGADPLAAVLEQDPQPPSALVPGLPGELERVILRCLRKDPARRFQHMGDVKLELLELREKSDAQSVPGGARAVVGATAAGGARSGRKALVVVAVLVVAVAAGGALLRRHRNEPRPPRLVQLTSERQAGVGSFSPDGSQMAFSWTGEKGDNEDIWLKIVGEAEARRLTTDPEPDRLPAWSPDGKQIAFLRGHPGERGRTIYLVSPLGGGERRLCDFPVGDQFSWSPDGLWLAASREWRRPLSGRGVYLIPTAGGEPRRLTAPRPPAFDAEVAFSPDGRELAYGGCESDNACDVYVLALDDEATPRGKARRLTRQEFVVSGLAWTRDGRSIVYGAALGMDSRLWRVRADGSAPPERVELAGAGVVGPFTATGDRLAFRRLRYQVDIHRLQLGAAAPVAVFESAFSESSPQYSPDGRRIAFGMDRVDEGRQVWLADADGSNATRLTRGPEGDHGSPRWSPDGRTIAFDVKAKNGRFDIWTVEVDGSRLRHVTFDPGDENMPSFSRDGRFLYYSSNRTGRHEIWRIPVAGGTEEQLTREGGFLPFESLDGRLLYYKRANGDAALLARPTSGGEERTIVPCVDGWAYAVTRDGAFHVDCATPGEPSAARRALRYWNAATGRESVVASLDFGPPAYGGLSASPDGKSVVYTSSSSGADLMMIENFR